MISRKAIDAQGFCKTKNMLFYFTCSFWPVPFAVPDDFVCDTTDEDFTIVVEQMKPGGDIIAEFMMILAIQRMKLSRLSWWEANHCAIYRI